MEIKWRKSCPLCEGSRQLQQVLLNLILKAIEAYERSERRAARAADQQCDQCSGQRLCCGPRFWLGLTPEGFDRAFQAFHTTKPDGMGMGCRFRWIVEAHGGRLWVNGERAARCYLSVHTGLRAGRARRDAAPLSPTR